MEVPELIREAKQGNANAQQSLFDRYADGMELVCRRYVKNREDAEELLLNGFYKFFKGLHSFHYKGEAALYVWLKKTMINECLMFLRKKTMFTVVAETDAEELMMEEDPLNNISANEIFNLIIRLPVGYRTIFNLYAIEGMSHVEIAALLGIAEGTSKSQFSKARTLLQKMLTQNETTYVTRKIK